MVLKPAINMHFLCQLSLFSLLRVGQLFRAALPDKCERFVEFVCCTTVLQFKDFQTFKTEDKMDLLLHS